MKMNPGTPVSSSASAVGGALQNFVRWLDGYGETSWDHQSYFAGPVGGRAKTLYYRHSKLGLLAVAPMIIVVLGNIGLTGLIPKSLISMYLCFFPVTIGMVKGLRSPETLQLDLMRTYSASPAQIFWKLRWPAATRFLFASLKIAVATSLVGAIVGELPTGAQAGLGARLLSGSYFGQTVQIWSALVMASLVGIVLVAAIGGIERLVARRMGEAA